MSQLDEYKEAEQDRESKRDRSARQRPEDDSAQASRRKQAKRDEKKLAEEQACRAVCCRLQVNCSNSMGSDTMGAPYGTGYEGVRLPFLLAKYQPYTPGVTKDAEARASWEERVREGRFVSLQVFLSTDRFLLDHRRHGFDAAEVLLSRRM